VAVGYGSVAGASWIAHRSWRVAAYGACGEFLGPLNFFYGPAHVFRLCSARDSARTRKSAGKVQFRRDLRALLEMLLLEIVELMLLSKL
jgi:hypothetical protein